MDTHTWLVIVCTATLIVVLILLFRSKKDTYEITDLASDVCKIDCMNRGYGRTICLDAKYLSNCISNLTQFVGTPPSGTSFSNMEIRQIDVGAGENQT